MIALRALGTAEIETSVTTLTPAQGIVFASALYLILERGRRVSRASLASLLWPRVEEKSRAHRLRQTILQLKKAGIALNADRNNVQLHRPEVSRDIDSLSAVDADQDRAQDSLEFLPGYSPIFSEPFREWVDTKRSDVHAAATRMLVRELERARTRGDWASVEKITADCLALDPYNEVAVLARAEASAMRGAKREAMAILDRYIEEVGPTHADIRLPASLLRRRIAERFPDHGTVLPIEPPFVGRESEMATLSSYLQSARVCKGSACLVIGEAGIGKSRLAAELGKFAELQGIVLQRVRCRRSDIDRPLSAFVDLVPSLRELPGAIGCSQETLVALKRLTEFDGRATEPVVPLDDLASLYLNTRRALFDLLDALAEERCLLIMIDDVQWLDGASIKLFVEMIPWSRKKKILFLFNSRPGASVLAGHDSPEELNTLLLLPLSGDPARTLLREMVSNWSRSLDDEVMLWLLQAGEGNPFFIQELAKHWLETGQQHGVPPSVATVLDRRLSTLSAEALHVLQACAVLGENATIDRVEALLEYKSHQLLTAAQELSVAGMLSSDKQPLPDISGQIRVRHDLLSSAALDKLAPVPLAFLHRRSGSVLEREISGQRSPTALLWACAFHWHHAGDRERAFTLARSCAEHLLEVGLPVDSVLAFERALEYCVTDDQRLLLLPRLAVALQMNGQWERSKDVLRLCRKLHMATSSESNPHDDFEIHLFDASWRASLENSTLLVEIESCVKSESASSRHRVMAGLVGLKIGCNLAASDTLRRLFSTISPLLDEPDVDPVTRYEVNMIYHSVLGDVETALQAMNQFLGVARAERNPLTLSRALGNAGLASRLAGRPAEAVALFSEARDCSAKNGLHNRAAMAAYSLVRLYLASGNIQEARHAMDQAETLARPDEDVHFIADRPYLVARMAMEEGDLSQASILMERIRQTTTPTQSVNRRASVLALGIQIGIRKGARRDDILEVVAELETVHAMNRTTGWQDFEAYSLFLGLCALGEGARGKQLLSDYATIYRREKWALPASLSQALS